MPKIKDGGQAYPGPSFTNDGAPRGHDMGMTRRDWFAGQALASLAMMPFTEEGGPSLKGLAAAKDLTVGVLIATMCYDYADAMIAVSEVEK